LHASAAPAACGTCVATGLDDDNMPSLRLLQCEGIWREPLVGSPALPKTASMKSSGVDPIDRLKARSR